MADTTSPGDEAAEVSRPTSSQTVTINFERDRRQGGRPPRFQLGVSECVETKTVTTTTRLTRKFPRFFVDEPPRRQMLDTKEYPLATKPTPPELISFEYSLADDEAGDSQRSGEPSDGYESAGKQLAQPPTDSNAQHTSTHESARSRHASSSPSRNSLVDPPSPTELCSRRTRQSKQAQNNSLNTPTAQTSTSSAPHTRSSQSKSLTGAVRRIIGRTGNSDDESTGPGSQTSRRQLRDRPARSLTTGYLATPDISEMAVSASAPHSGSQSYRSQRARRSPTSEPNRANADACDVASPTGSDAQTIYSSNVATPPVTDNDLQSSTDVDESLQQSIRAIQQRPAIDIAAAQDASLPSPRLSPTLAAAQLHTADNEDDAEIDSSFQTSEPANRSLTWTEDPDVKEEDALGLVQARPSLADVRALVRRDAPDEPFVIDSQMLLEAFDSMKTPMKTFMMYQFLRRCARPTLRVVADAVNPALKCDFLQQLPLELGYHVLAYLGHRDLCRAAQVSKQWRNMVDRNETGWKDLFDRDGYKLAPGELQKAITQGWGWQDPVGALGYEADLSLQHRLTSSEKELTRSAHAESAAPRLRTSKRKRGLNSYSTAGPSKRRASAQEAAALRDDRGRPEIKQHRSEGPLSAANAAAAAVPDPNLGLPSLRELHLFKSLYRRHHMIRRSWTSGEVKPKHVAFAAHPRHVITCLQFDDDKLITGSDDTLIHIYDTKTGKLRKKLEGHEGGVWALQYQGNMLVSGSTDRSVRVWDIERGLCQQVFYGHTSTVRCLQILMPTEMGRDSRDQAIMQPEKPLIITGSRDSQLRVWRLPEVGSRRYIQTGPPAQESDCPYFIRTLAGHTHSVRAISAHGDTLVSGSYDSTVRVWRISTGQSRYVLTGHTQKVYSVVYDHERNRCISGSMDSLVKIWDLTDGSCIFTLEGHTLLVGLLDLRDDRLVSAAADSTLRIWDPETGKCRNTLMAHTGAITCFQHDGQKVISGSERTVKMWDTRTGELIQDLLTDLSGMWQVKFDERRCVTAVQRDQLTYVEILDYGAVRDGVPPEQLGKRILLNEPEVRALIEEEM